MEREAPRLWSTPRTTNVQLIFNVAIKIYVCISPLMRKRFNDARNTHDFHIGVSTCKNTTN